MRAHRAIEPWRKANCHICRIKFSPPHLADLEAPVRPPSVDGLSSLATSSYLFPCALNTKRATWLAVAKCDVVATTHSVCVSGSSPTDGPKHNVQPWTAARTPRTTRPRPRNGGGVRQAARASLHPLMYTMKSAASEAETMIIKIEFVVGRDG